jgi:hypothetical protein
MTIPLYPSESEIAALVMGSKRAREWPAKARYLEDKQGLPRIDTLMGGRYWPAVVEYFRLRQGARLDALPMMQSNARVRIVPIKSEPHGKETSPEASGPNYRRRKSKIDEPE